MLTIFDVIVGVIFGSAIFEVLYWMARLAFEDSKKETVDQDMQDYLETIKNISYDEGYEEALKEQGKDL